MCVAVPILEFYIIKIHRKLIKYIESREKHIGHT